MTLDWFFIVIGNYRQVKSIPYQREINVVSTENSKNGV